MKKVGFCFFFHMLKKQFTCIVFVQMHSIVPPDIFGLIQNFDLLYISKKKYFTF